MEKGRDSGLGCGNQTCDLFTFSYLDNTIKKKFSHPAWLSSCFGITWMSGWKKNHELEWFNTPTHIELDWVFSFFPFFWSWTCIIDTIQWTNARDESVTLVKLHLVHQNGSLKTQKRKHIQKAVWKTRSWNINPFVTSQRICYIPKLTKDCCCHHSLRDCLACVSVQKDPAKIQFDPKSFVFVKAVGCKQQAKRRVWPVFFLIIE